MAANRRRSWLKTGTKAGFAVAVLYLMLRWFEHAQVYHPTRTLDATPAAAGLAFEDVHFKSGDGVELHGWFLPALTNAPRRDLGFLVCHGNGGNISHRLGLAAALVRTGASVFLFDYRGYGQSQGRPGEEGTYRDAQAAAAWLRAKGFAATNIVAYGESLGGAVATELAVRETVGGLVLQSTFTSVPDLGADLFPWLPVRWLGTIRYATRTKLPRVWVPVLVMHSRSDTLIPFRHAEANFAAANEPKWFCELHGDHNDAVYEQPAYAEGMEKLLQRVSQSPPSSAGR